MFIYDYLIIILLLLYCLEIISGKYKRNLNKRLYLTACYVMALFVLFADYTKAYDMSDYLMTYHNNPSSMYGTPDDPNPPSEPGFGWLCKLLWLFPIYDIMLIFACKIISFLPILYGIYNHSSFKIGSLIFLITLPGVWLVQIITQRQALSFSFILMALFVLVNRKKHKWWPIWFIILCSLSITFHSTPLLVIPIILVLYYVPINKKTMYVLLIMSCVLSRIFYNYFSQYFLLFFAASEGLERMTRYIEDQDAHGVGSVDMLYNIFYTLFALFLVYYNDGKNKMHEICLKSMVLGWSIFLLIKPLPNSDRATSFLFCLGAIGALPKHTKRCMLILLFFLLALSLQKHMSFSKQDYWPQGLIWW